MITIKEVEHVAKLARLELTEEEKRLAVQNMVPYFESLTDIRFVKTACNYLRFKVYLRPENVEKMHKNQ